MSPEGGHLDSALENATCALMSKNQPHGKPDFYASLPPTAMARGVKMVPYYDASLHAVCVGRECHRAQAFHCNFYVFYDFHTL